MLCKLCKSLPHICCSLITTSLISQMSLYNISMTKYIKLFLQTLHWQRQFKLIILICLIMLLDHLHSYTIIISNLFRSCCTCLSVILIHILSLIISLSAFHTVLTSWQSNTRFGDRNRSGLRGSRSQSMSEVLHSEERFTCESELRTE